MACGCRKGRSNDSRTAGSSLRIGPYEVWRNGAFTGRSFASLSSAQTYATRIGGEVVVSG